MRFLGIGDSCDLGSLYLDLIDEGHFVKVFIAEALCRGTLRGMVDQVDDWEAQLDWVREAGREGFIIFENVAENRGALQDDLRRKGFNVIGGSALGDRLENDRAYAQSLLSKAGLQTAGVWEFSEASAAEAFVLARPARYVVKFNGPDFESRDNFVGQSPKGDDVIAMVRATLADASNSTFILMEYVTGVEMGVGAYFNGEQFLLPACLDWEHKRFFPGDLGELTGEMGTVVTFERSSRMFERTLKPLEPILRESGHCGYINLNTIVNQHVIWPLEFTCRFGYPGFAILGFLQKTAWAELFHAMAHRSALRFETHTGFAIGVVLTTPPFPYTRRQVDERIGAPIIVADDIADDPHRKLHPGEVGICGETLVTSGIYGWTMVATGRGPTIAAAKERAYEAARRVVTPNLRYRIDIGDKLLAGELRMTEQWGFLDEPAA